jgi:Flp pilus assembly protein TadG
MMILSAMNKLVAKVRGFVSASSGNVTTLFALSIIPVVGGVGAAIDFSQANSIRTSMQAASDVASLGTVKVASTLTAQQLTSTAVNFFNSSFNRPGVTPTVTVSYDAASNKVTVTASAVYVPSMVKIFGVSQIPLSTVSKAVVGPKIWQVCVMVTDPASNHTLLTKNASTIDFTNCMVQVNTQNWDAVEARDTSYIHSVNGENCFVGDIHYGDIVPPKNPTCTFFTDPFASYNVSTNACTYTNKKVTTAGTTLSPGTYCGGIDISANVTFSPGLYYIQSGDFKVSGSANVTADNVTFLISGSGSNLNINTTGTLTLSPYVGGTQWDGFVFYYDQPTSKTSSGTSIISKATVNMSGVIYLVGQTLSLTSGAEVTINPGSIIAGFILPDGASKLNLTGTLNSSLAILGQLKKTGATTGGAVLTQ